MAAVLLLAGATGAGAIALGASPAGAAPAAAPTLRVSPASNLDPGGAFVVVSGSGYLPNVQLFVMECRASSTTDHTCNSVGLRKVTTSAQGTFTANAMKVVANFGATNCFQVPCAVKTSAVSDHADDRSQDREAAIAFRAPAPPPTTAPPVTAPPTTAVPQAAPPTTAPSASVTTTARPADQVTTTTAGSKEDDPKATTTTAADRDGAEVADEDAESGPDTDGGPDGESAARGSVDPLAVDANGDGSSPVVPILIVLVLAAAGIGAYVLISRRREPGSEP